MPIDQTSIVVRSETSMTAPLDNELVVVSLASNAYIALDEIGRRIWEMLETPRSVAELCATLADEFSGPIEEIQSDVLSFLTELESVGLLNVTPARPA